MFTKNSNSPIVQLDASLRFQLLIVAWFWLELNNRAKVPGDFLLLFATSVVRIVVYTESSEKVLFEPKLLETAIVLYPFANSLPGNSRSGLVILLLYGFLLDLAQVVRLCHLKSAAVK